MLSMGLSFAAVVLASQAVPQPLGRLVDVGGYRLHLYCTGEGSPTVMVVGGGFSFDWGLVQPEVARFTRVCTYDPSGSAWSDPPPQANPKCSDRIAEIHRLLEDGAVQGPYVLVGFSIGGAYARLYADSYPGDVSGIVIVDHAFVELGDDSESPPAKTGAPETAPVLIFKTPIVLGIEDDKNFSKLPRRNQEMHLWAISNHQAKPTPEDAEECNAEIEDATKGKRYPLGDTPIAVVSTTNASPGYDKLQLKLLSLSRNSRQLIAENSTHMVIVDEPETIIDAVHQLVNEERSRLRLRK